MLKRNEEGRKRVWFNRRLIRKIGDGMDDYEAIKKLIIETLYSRELSKTPEEERDNCASVIRSMDLEEIKKTIRVRKNAGETVPRDCDKDKI